MLSLDSKNYYPDCFSMQLAGNRIPTSNTDLKQIELYLTLNFNQQWEPLLGGRVKFGLKGGELKLKVENGEISAAACELGELLQVKQIKSQSDLSWLFTVKATMPVLQGIIEQAKLGTVKINALPCSVEATFVVSPQDVYITDAEGLWRHNLSPNQHAVLIRRLGFFLLEARLLPYLSWAQLCYGCSPVSPEGLKQNQEAIAFSPDTLQALIQRLSEAKTKDFFELANMAGLNPLEDFTGSYLCGTNLSNINLSGANLSGANFRGADLSDTDLSEANLSSANFRGADLSGAYLSNADLSFSDLYRASLAIANLSGANLSGANLTEANLSHANFSGVNLEKAKFTQNCGIPEQVKQDLKQRGAIFV